MDLYSCIPVMKWGHCKFTSTHVSDILNVKKKVRRELCMKFSQSVDLALHALWFMARNTPGQPVMIKDVALGVRASESYMARVMLWLTKADILKSIRGKKGGFVFKKSPDNVTIADVVLAIDTDLAEYSCPRDERGCAPDYCCALVSLFQDAQQEMLNVLSRMTIADIVAMGDKEQSSWLVPVQLGSSSLSDSANTDVDSTKTATNNKNTNKNSSANPVSFRGEVTNF